MSKLYKYPNSIEEAAKILDEAFPDWAKKINLNMLNQDESNHCILGQIFNGYGKGMKELFALDIPGWPLGLIYADDEIFGKKASIDRWKDEIEKRKLMTFAEALELAKKGIRVKRKGCPIVNFVKHGHIPRNKFGNMQSLSDSVFEDDWIIDCD